MSNPFIFKPAREAAAGGTPLLLGVMGPSGGGKTFTALRLAKGIQSVVGGKIAAIDTEARRMLRYSRYFDFEYLEFGPKFSSERYLQAMQAAAAIKDVKTVIVDSMSHEHEGDGGYLSLHEAELQRMAGDDYGKRDRMKFAAWIKPAGERRKLINGVLQLNCNLIFCFRAKEKIALKPKDGKIVPVDLGWQVIAGEEFAFEMTTMIVLPPRAEGRPDWEAQAAKIEEHHKAFFPAGEQITEKTGADMARWSLEQVTGQQAPATQPTGKIGAKWGAGVTTAVAGAKTLAELEDVVERAGPNMLAYKEWNAEKWADLQTLIRTTREELTPKGDSAPAQPGALI
jgi:hypothetical protein